jgi:phosphoglycolate phosphatase/putative hydrolase of the HAD superfamily
MAGSVISPVDPQKQIRGVLFDLDGTLYHQPRLRSLMMAELLTLPLYGLTSAPRRYRALAAYRQAQEELRRHPPAQSLAEAQLTVAAARAGLPLAAVRSLVDEWMMKRPLK